MSLEDGGCRFDGLGLRRSSDCAMGGGLGATPEIFLFIRVKVLWGIKGLEERGCTIRSLRLLNGRLRGRWRREEF